MSSRRCWFGCRVYQSAPSRAACTYHVSVRRTCSHGRRRGCSKRLRQAYRSARVHAMAAFSPRPSNEPQPTVMAPTIMVDSAGKVVRIDFVPQDARRRYTPMVSSQASLMTMYGETATLVATPTTSMRFVPYWHSFEPSGYADGGVNSS